MFMQKYTYICWIHTDAMNNRCWKTSLTIFTSHFIARFWKGLLKVCVWEGTGDRTELKYFDPHSYGRQRCVFLILLMLNWRPWGPLCWGLAFFTTSYQHLLWTPTHQGLKAPSAWCGFPYHISSITPSPALTQLAWDSNSTELYNSSTPTRSPTRSLKSHV